MYLHCLVVAAAAFAETADADAPRKPVVAETCFADSLLLQTERQYMVLMGCQTRLFT